MTWLIFVFGAAVSWGMYGPTLHIGQMQLGNPMRSLLCVGAAYFLCGVLVPVFALRAQGQLHGFNKSGVTLATAAGALGALGAVFIILAFRYGGLPVYVMPLVYAGAPVVNVGVSMWLHPPKKSPHPLLYAGFIMAITGAALVLYYKPAG